MKKTSLYFLSALLSVSICFGAEVKLTASDAEDYDRLGHSISISGDYAIVGAYGEDAGGSGAGAAYIFYRNQGGENNWGEMTKLIASDAEADDQFGKSVSISGDYAISGAVNEGGDDAGAAYIYYRHQDGTDSWGQTNKLTASDADSADGYGNSVSIGKDYPIIGAYLNDDGGMSKGSAYIYTDVVSNLSQKTSIIKKYRLFKNYPNPFNPETVISYRLPVPGFVELAVYNLLGQKVRTLVNTNKPAGTYSVTWNGRNETGQKAASGIYIYKIEADNFVQSRKMILMK